MATPVETVFEDEELRLRWLPGRLPRMVVVFTGMKARFGGAPVDEFARSAACGGQNNVLFVTDRRATWYAAPGLWRRIVRFVRYLRRSEGMREVLTLGTSMGGFGALLLPRDVRVLRAVAFAPQVTMDPEILADDRWPPVKARWGTLPARSVADVVASGRTQYYVAAGAGCAEDMAHLDLLPDTPRVRRYLLPDGRHNPARALKEAGLLPIVVAAMLRGQDRRAARLLAGIAGAP